VALVGALSHPVPTCHLALAPFALALLASIFSWSRPQGPPSLYFLAIAARRLSSLALVLRTCFSCIGSCAGSGRVFLPYLLVPCLFSYSRVPAHQPFSPDYLTAPTASLPPILVDSRQFPSTISFALRQTLTRIRCPHPTRDAHSSHRRAQECLTSTPRRFLLDQLTASRLPQLFPAPSAYSILVAAPTPVSVVSPMPLPSHNTAA
jgi:hypothetical protein